MKVVGGSGSNSLLMKTGDLRKQGWFGGSFNFTPIYYYYLVNFFSFLFYFSKCKSTK